jgi:hypothetical protein
VGIAAFSRANAAAKRSMLAAAWRASVHSIRHGTINPDDSLRSSWDVLMMVLISYYAVTVPVEVAFETRNFLPDAAEIIFNMFFIVDIGMNFCTAVHVDGDLCHARSVIRARYMRFWFWPDLIASVPFDLLTQQLSRAYSYNKLLRFLRIFKLARVLKIGRLLKTLEQEYKFNPALITLFKAFSLLMVMWLWSGCGYWTIARIERAAGLCSDSDSDSDSGHVNLWCPEERMFAAPLATRFAHAIFWGVVVTTGTGWDIIPETPIEVTSTR